MHVERGDGGFEVLAADVVEVDVDPVRCGLLQLVLDGAALVVEGGVEAVALDQLADLLVGPGRADDAGGALEPGDLADEAAHGAGGAGDEHRVALLEGGDLQEARVGREPGHAEDAQVIAERREGSVDLGGVPGLHLRVLAPAEAVQHMVADVEAPASEAMTSPTAPPSIGRSSAYGSTYDFTSFIRPRMYGSTEKCRLRTRMRPSPGAETGASRRAKSSGAGQPCGRATRCHSRLVAGSPDMLMPPRMLHDLKQPCSLIFHVVK